MAPPAPHRPATKSLRRSPSEQDRAPPQRSSSFHGRTASSDQHTMRRPKTHPDLFTTVPRPGGRAAESRTLLDKVLVNVTVLRSLGPVQVIASADWTVRDLVAAALRLYIKEGRRPLLAPPSKAEPDPSEYGLHYSQFSLECLDPNEKVMGLGSRNFFLCPKSVSASAVAAASPSTQTMNPLSSSSSSSPCSKEAGDKASSNKPIPWFKFMDFLF